MFNCRRCGYSTDRKCNMRCHFNREVICISTLEDTSIAELLSQLSSQKPNAALKKPTRLLLQYPCGCGKSYKSRAGLYYHSLKCTKISDDSNTVIHTQNNIQTQNTNQTFIENQNHYHTTVKLQEFGQETLDHLAADVVNRLVHYRGLTQLFEMIYFNPDVPANMTIMNKDWNSKKRRGNVLVHEGGAFHSRDARDAIATCTEKVTNALREASMKVLGQVTTDDEKRDTQMKKLTWLGNLRPNESTGAFGVLACTAHNAWLNTIKTKSDEAKSKTIHDPTHCD